MAREPGARARAGGGSGSSPGAPLRSRPGGGGGRGGGGRGGGSGGASARPRRQGRSPAPAARLRPFLAEYLRPLAGTIAWASLFVLAVALIEVALIRYAGRLVDLLGATPPGEVWARHGLELALVAGFVLLDAGRIAEEGRHADLLARDGLQARFWRRQSGGFLECGGSLPAAAE